MYTYDQLRKGDKTLQQVEKEQKKFKSELNEITRGSKKSKKQFDIIKNVKNLYDSNKKLKLTDKLDLRRGKNIIALSNLSIYYTWKNIKSSCNNNKFKKFVPTWNDKFELPDGSYSLPNIWLYFECIFKKHGENTDKTLVQIYDIENRVTFKIKDGYSLELLTPEIMKLFGALKIEQLNSKTVTMCRILKLKK